MSREATPTEPPGDSLRYSVLMPRPGRSILAASLLTLPLLAGCKSSSKEPVEVQYVAADGTTQYARVDSSMVREVQPMSVYEKKRLLARIQQDPRQLRRYVVELVCESLADLVDREPRDVPDVERVGM